MIKIAITDDHPLLLEGLKNILNKNQQIKVIQTFIKLENLFTDLLINEIDVLLLDININEHNSIESISKILSLNPEIQIIMLSIHNEVAVINSCFNEGAMGYIQKNASIEEIIDGIITVNRGDKFMCNETKKTLKEIDSETLESIPRLTRREKEILHEAAQGLTTHEIAEKLFISPHTVETHRKNLIFKFKTKNLNSAIKLAIEYNII